MVLHLHRNEQGNYFILSTVVFLVLIILTVGIVEFGRVMMYRNQLQTAGDAAALAAAGADEDVTKWVKLVVTTDRGQQTFCDDESCWCSGCGTVSINVSGLEEELLDKGGWQDFCVPPCDCGGDDCTVQITDRWVTMTTATVATGASQQDINEAIQALLNTSKISLSYRAFNDQSNVYATLKNVSSLEGIRGLLQSNAAWVSRYANTNCSVYWNNEDSQTYNACVAVGYNDWQQMQSGSEQLNHMIDAQNKLQNMGPGSTTAGVTREYVGEIIHDYLAANSPGSWVKEVEVYDQRNSPYYPSVVVYAMQDIPVMMKDFIRIPLLLDPQADYLFGEDGNVTTVEICSQGDTHYIDPTLTQYSEYGELTAAPDERYYVQRPDNACWN